jgi:hypothetical protein
MERTKIFDLMSELKLYGMKTAYDEIMAAGIKRQHEPPRIVGDLLQAEVSEKQARSIKYQIAIAELPLAKDIDEFVFTCTPINERLVRDLAQGDFLAEQRNCVWSVEPAPEKPIWPSLSPAIAFAPANGAAFITPSISSTGSRPKRAAGARDGSRNISSGKTSSCSTNSAISPSPRPEVSCCLI